MFTGLVEEIGTIKKAERKGGSVVFTISAPRITASLRVNDSVAVDGTCLTVIRKKNSYFDTQAVEETLSKTTLGTLRADDRVNLERPLLSTSRLGGHFVLGHVDCVGKVTRVEKRKSSWMFWLKVPKRFTPLLIPVGSVAVNGVSLTVAALRETTFGVSIIPHTMSRTTFQLLQIGNGVNIEFDVLGKCVERLLSAKRR